MTRVIAIAQLSWNGVRHMFSELVHHLLGDLPA